MPRDMARTWHFHVTLRMPRLSQQEEVRDTFKGILISANNRLPLCGVEQSSFSYDVPDDGIATIDGYLHVNSRSLLANTAVSKWIFDDRIIEDIVWTPIRPGLKGDWRQHSLIKRVLAVGDDFDGGTESGPRRIEDWVGTSSEKIDRGGRPRQNRAPSADRSPAENGGSEADQGGGALPPRGRGRPARPQLVEEDTAAQAAVRNKLRSMLTDTLHAMCTILNHKTTKRTPTCKGIACESISQYARQARAACCSALYRRRTGPRRSVARTHGHFWRSGFVAGKRGHTLGPAHNPPRAGHSIVRRRGRGADTAAAAAASRCGRFAAE